MKSDKKTLLKNIILSTASGIMLVLSFPRFDLYWVAWFALVPLLYCILDVSWKRAFLLGFITGLTFNLTAFHWSFSDFLKMYANVPLYVSFIIYLVLGLYLAFYYGVFSLAVNRLSNRLNFPVYLSAPFIFVFLEYIRANVFTGFPWELLGYSQYKFLPLIQIADITGVYGVSFIVILFNSTAAEALKRYTTEKKKVPLKPVLFALVITIPCLIYGFLRLNQHEKETRYIRISLIQANISQTDKMSNEVKVAQSIIDTYGKLTYRALDNSPDLIIWPETAMPFIFGLNKKPSEGLLEFQKKTGKPLLAGLTVLKDNEKRIFSNGAVLIKDGVISGIYDKMKLVPFGEFVPFGLKTKKIIENFDYMEGQDYTVMDVNGIRFSPLICYEIIFPTLARNFVSMGAELLIAISNDAWFGKTSAPYQHFSMAVFRAVENRVPIARAANSGVSGFIDEKGRILKQSDIFKDESLTEIVTVSRHNSFYTQHGDMFVYICIGLSCILLTVMILSQKFNITFSKRHNKQ